ncbi:MAG: acetyltransferase [Polyangiaceae bacterium]|nr:acetyltransferase [Polyangiaceae bacterium]
MVSVFIHPSAEVHPSASLGSGTKVWHGAQVLEGAQVGADSMLGQGVFLGRGVQVGMGCRLQNGAQVFSGVELEDFVFLGPGVTFTNVKRPRAFQAADKFERTVVKEGASLGARSTILCGLTIGRYALVGAGAIVTKDIPDYGEFVGQPAKQVGWVCRCGAPLRMDSSDALYSCERCPERYRRVGGQLFELKSSEA